MTIKTISKEPKIKPSLPTSYILDMENSPANGLNLLREMELLGLNIPIEYGGRGIGHMDKSVELLTHLKQIGAYDLSLGRIFEGHINAILLLERFGSAQQKGNYYNEALNGRYFGIWNSEFPQEQLKFSNENGKLVLKGAKVFCSGASFIDRPIVTAEGPDGIVMIILHLDEYAMQEDYTYWRPMGMKSSVSCRFDFTGQTFDEKQILGSAYDYVAEPDFSTGAARFAAVQLGAAEAAIRATYEHLNKMKRKNAPEQIVRLGKLSILLESGKLWLKGAGESIDKRYSEPVNCVQYINMFRTVIREICEEILRLCELSVGLQGMMAPHPLERIHRDLSVYLKQPGPDRVLNQVGKSFTV